MNKKILVPLVILIIILVIGAIIGISFWLDAGKETVPFQKVDKNQTGTVEGSLGYPSEFIPDDMKICAEKIVTKEQYCTGIHIKDAKYQYGEGYKIDLQPGDYYVFATVPNLQNYKAYYSEFVTCGNRVDCPSHNPIKVTVKSGQTTGGIDPQDWYNKIH